MEEKTGEKMKKALAWLLGQVGDRPELAYMLFGTETLFRCVEAYAEAIGKSPESVMKMISGQNREVKEARGIYAVEIRMIRCLPDAWCEIGDRRKYRGWIITHPEESRYLCFTPENSDYTEEGYEDYETDCAEDAKAWIDDYERED